MNSSFGGGKINEPVNEIFNKIFLSIDFFKNSTKLEPNC